MKKLLALVSAVVVVGGIAVGVTASQAGASSEFTVVAHGTNAVFVTATGGSLVPKGPLVPGDRLILRADLLQNGAVVGGAVVVCTVMFNSDLFCDGMDTITNRGDLHVTTLLRGAVGPSGIPKVFDLVVDGGTFAFSNAHGSGHVVVQANGDQVTTYALG
jgi:hypothetical protein